MSYDDWELDPVPVRQPKGYGRGWCGRCSTYHAVEEGCDEKEEFQ